MQRTSSTSRQTGFTVIELLVVVSIMVLIATIVVIGFNTQRPRRNIKIAQNELVTNIRKVQSYVLSSRDYATGLPSSFYVLQFPADTGVMTSYAIYAVDSAGAYQGPLERINLPDQISIKKMELVTASGNVEVGCAQVAFAAPFGKTYIETAVAGLGTCSFSDPAINLNASQLLLRSNLVLQITLGTPLAPDRIVRISGVTGAVTIP
jgi:prepilin-type N-terminal cleavage/methylation domain-containing protein